MVEQCARKSNENSGHRSGHDIEPIALPREDVKLGNDEDEEHLEAEVPRARMNTQESYESRETR